MNGTARLLNEVEDSMQEPMLWREGVPQTQQGFSRLVDAYKDDLVRYAFRRLGDLQLAEDLAQDVFIRTYQARERCGNVGNVRAYLYKVAANLCVDSLRKGKHGESGIADDILTLKAKEPSAPEAVAAWEQLQRIEAILRRIPKDQAEVLRLHVLDELAFSEIAEVTGCSTATAKSRFRYGLERVRRAMGKGEEV
jgi:RNA polymerase sigma-70 factor, ECF subfamily